MRLANKVAIITGAASGMGAATARRFGKEGAAVVVADMLEDEGRAVADSINHAGGKALFLGLNVTDEAGWATVVDETVRAFGRLDILVNNAGTSVRKMPELLSDDEWHHVLDTNLTSAFVCSQAAYPVMKAGGGGKMINTASMMSLFGAPYATAYCASKGGLVQMTRALATAWAKDNIQVNAILPGWIDTELTRSARRQVDGLHARVEARTPVGRWGVPPDLSGIAAFLASPASDFVTGTAIPVDGGFSISM
jgi:2-deoxy-D-gluconate 3-dehydrogenase